MNEFAELQAWLPFIVPILVIQLLLIVAALADLVRREETRGPKWLWLIVIVFLNLLGPILYFILGREEL